MPIERIHPLMFIATRAGITVLIPNTSWIVVGQLQARVATGVRR